MNTTESAPSSDPLKTKSPRKRFRREGPWWATAAWSLFLGVGFLICGGIGVGMYWFRPTFKEGGAAAEKLTPELLTLNVPPSFQPVGTIEWNVAHLITMRGVYYDVLPSGADTHSGLFMLLEVDSRFGDDVTVRKHIQSVLFEEGAGGSPVVIINGRDVEYTVRQDKTPFRITLGKIPNTENLVCLVQGVVPGKHGDVMIGLRVPKEDWDEEGFIRMLGSIRE